MDLDPNTLIAASAGLVGVIVGAAVAEARTILAENRARHRRERYGPMVRSAPWWVLKAGPDQRV